jgi:hypothetical protein
MVSWTTLLAKLWHIRLPKRIAPSRLVLLSSTSGSSLPNLISPTVSSTLTSIIVHPPETISSLHSAYLFPPPVSGDLSEAGTTGGSRFRGILENATRRNEALRLTLTGELGASVGDWVEQDSVNSSANYSGQSAGSTAGEASSSAIASGVVVEILVRKAAGGASKGMVRRLEGLRPSAVGKGKSGVSECDLEACRWQDIKGLESLASGYQAVRTPNEEAEGDIKKKDEGKVSPAPMC